MSVLSPGIDFKADTSSYLRLSFDELQWQQAEHDLLRQRFRLGNLQRTGLMIERRGDLASSDWQVLEDPSNPGYLVIGGSDRGIQTAIDANGRLLWISGQHRPYTLSPARALALHVPNDGTWRTLVVRRATTYYAPGTLNFSSSTTLTGTGTDFTRFSATTEGEEGTLIRIDASDNATLGAHDSGLGAGIFELATVADATNATLGVTAPATASGVPYSVVGAYNPTPATLADRDMYVYEVPDFELVTRTRDAANQDIILADVRQVSGTMEIIPRQAQHTMLVRGDHRSKCDLRFYRGSSGVAYQRISVLAGSIDARNISVAPYAEGMLVVHGRGDSSVRATQVKDGAVVGTVTIASIGGVYTPLVVDLPSKGSNLHAAFWVDTKVVKMKTSADGGATWSSESTVVDTTAEPGGVYATSICKALVLRNGRLLLAVRYRSAAAASGYVRFLYNDTVTDDSTGTWVTNSTAGYSFTASDEVSESDVVQDDYDQVWIVENDITDGMRVTLVKKHDLIGGSAAFTETVVIPDTETFPTLLAHRNGATLWARSTDGVDDTVYQKELVPLADLSGLVATQPMLLLHLGSTASYQGRMRATWGRGGEAWLGLLDISGANSILSLLPLQT